MLCISKPLDTQLIPSSFWNSVNILTTKPHVINNRLWGSKTWFKFVGTPNRPTWKLPFTCPKLEFKVTTENIEQLTVKICIDLDITKSEEIDSYSTDGLEVMLIELLPKSHTREKEFQVVCLYKTEVTVKFYNVSPTTSPENLCPNFSYSLSLHNNIVTLSAECDKDSKSFKWLTNNLLPQFVKWGLESEHNLSKNNSLCNESLTLVCQRNYYEKYNYLKIKYGKEMVKIWPECTDPSKFVYEDIAIAAYLLLLWDIKGNSKKSFVDLGCGNGLLVYMLSEEGHVGIGMDVRKRQIWNMYPSHIKLEERTIIPSDISLFPETDWIIGNHSDELTPWIPIIATRSSYKCNFFLLPCCSYNFDGSKYQRKNSFKSQYVDYLEYIKGLCEECGFNVETDRLKIPSTKRICLVGRIRSYTKDKHTVWCKNIQKLITEDNNENRLTNDAWIKGFKAREPMERVKNCTQLDHNLISSIVDSISKYLLEGCMAVPSWSIGKTVDLSELVQLIPQDKLNFLKSECGGIQTLLKNNHNIFKVQKGKVQLRHPETIDEVIKKKKKKKHISINIKIKQKPCWFYQHHPKGCPLSDQNCSYLHENKNHVY